MIEISQALDQFAEEDREAAELVKLRLFAGLSVVESGKMLGLSERQANENWKFAQAWFAESLDSAGN